MDCPRCKSVIRPSVGCESCQHLTDHQLRRLIEKRAPFARQLRSVGVIALATAAVLGVVGLAVLLIGYALLGIVGLVPGALVFAACVSCGAFGANKLEEAKPYRQLRSFSPEEILAAKRAIDGAVSSGGSPVGVPSSPSGY